MASTEQSKQIRGKSCLLWFKFGYEGKIKEISSNVYDFLGYSQSEIERISLDKIIKSADEFEKILKDNFRKDASFSIRFIPFIGKDGSVKICESVLIPLIDESGEAKTCLCFVKKLSRQASGYSAELEKITPSISGEWKKFLDLIISIFPVPVFYTDKEARYIGCNRAFEEFFGLTAEQIYGKTVEQLFPGKKSQEFYQKDLEVIKNNLRETKQIELVDTKNRQHQILMVKTVYPDETGTTAGMIAILMDVSPLKQAEDEKLKMLHEVQQAQRLESLGLLAGGVAHDFNNMLTVILGNIDLALADIPSQYAAVEYLKDARSTCLKAADLCRQMLLFTGRMPFNRQLVNLNSIIQDMNKLLQAAISRRVYIQYRFTQPLPLIEADPAQVKQVIMTLVVNASEAMGDKPGVITITTGWMKCDNNYLKTTVPVCRVGLDKPMKQGTYVFLEVTDSGCGMDAETQKRIFDPFFTTKFFGRGLGLAAVLGIMRSHRGGIKVYSEPGKGTTFKILFPSNGSGKLATAKKFEPEQKAETPKATVLVVDDEEGVRNFVRKCLEKLGIKALMASNGDEALEIFSKHKDEIDAVLLDFSMPGKPSKDVYRELRLMKPGVKVVLCSGYSEDQAVSRFIGKGLAGFLQKPYGVIALREKLFSLLPQDRILEREDKDEHDGETDSSTDRDN